jgi:hypothetical protein
LLIVFIAALVLSTGWSKVARLFPQLIVIAAIVLSLWPVVSGFIYKPSLEQGESEPTEDDRRAAYKQTKQKIPPRNEILMMLWVLGFLGLILVFGFWLAIAVFVPLFMHVVGHETKKIIVVYAASTWIAIYLIFAVSMKVPLYGGVFELAW